MPSDATAGSYNLKVAGTGTGVTDFEESKSLVFKREGFAILVQSDKAIYKPGQTSKFTNLWKLTNQCWYSQQKIIPPHGALQHMMELWNTLNPVIL